MTENCFSNNFYIADNGENVFVIISAVWLCFSNSSCRKYFHILTYRLFQNWVYTLYTVPSPGPVGLECNNIFSRPSIFKYMLYKFLTRLIWAGALLWFIFGCLKDEERKSSDNEDYAPFKSTAIFTQFLREFLRWKGCCRIAEIETMWSLK